MTKINVLQIADFPAPYPANFFSSMRALESAITKTGGETVYILPEEAREREWVRKEIAAGRLIKFFPFRPAGLKTLRKFCFMLNNIIKEKDITILHAHFANKIALLAIQLVKTKQPKIKVVIHYRNHYWLPKGRLLFAYRLKKLMGRFLHRSDASIGVSQSVTANLPFKHNRHVVLNAINFSRLDNYIPLSPDTLGIAANQPIICMFGFDYQRKGVDLAIRELEPIADEWKLVLLIVCASEIEEKRETILRDFGYMPQWIKLVPSRLDVAAYYALADIFLSASREEGLPSALTEATYIKTPLVASNAPGQNELSIIPHSVFYDNQKPGALRKAVLSVLNWSEAERKQKTAEAHEFVIKTFDLEAWAKKIVKIYETLLSND